MGDILQEGGEFNIKRTGPDEYQFSLHISRDEDGMISRECTIESCSPGYFKVKPGTGITKDQNIAYCPYCRNSAKPNEFMTKTQRKYVKDVMVNETKKGMDREIRKALELNSSGKRKLGSGMITAELSMEPSHFPRIFPPIEEAIRRDLTCPNCGLEHAVFGLAIWCPDCGSDIFLSHLEKELESISKIVAAVEQRKIELGRRVAARDIENALEDIVSIFEAVLKFILRRYLIKKGSSAEEVNDVFDKRIRNHFQNPSKASEIYNDIVGISLFEGITEEEMSFIKASFEKRHPITHNLGVIDRKYIERAISGGLEGREIRITTDEIERLLSLVQKVINNLYSQLYKNE
jgi:hypothetical protein